MKKLLSAGVAIGIALVAVIAAISSGCNGPISRSISEWSDGDLKAATNVIETGNFPPGLESLEVDNRFGNVRITGSSNGVVGWSWKLAVRAGDQAAVERFARGATCKSQIDNGQLILLVSLPEITEPHSFQSDIEVSVPDTLSVRAENRFGRIEIAGVNGDVEAADQNGSVTLRNIGGAVHAQTSFDTLSVSNAAAVTLKNQNGKITAFSIHGALDAKTSFDSLTARDVEGDSILHNQNGSIDAVNIGGSLNAETSFDSLIARHVAGSVRLRNQNGSVKTTWVGGDADVQTSFDVLTANDVRGDANLVNQNGEVDAGGVAGGVTATTSFAPINISGPGAKFVCHNQNGSVRLRATSTALRNIEARTSFDALEVHLPGALKPAIQAHTTFDDVESDFPVMLAGAGRDPFARAGTDVARVTLENQNGKIGVIRD